MKVRIKLPEADDVELIETMARQGSSFRRWNVAVSNADTSNNSIDVEGDSDGIDKLAEWMSESLRVPVVIRVIEE